MPEKNNNNFVINMTAGGIAGFCEAMSCHPLDTIKVRMQLTRTVDPTSSTLYNGTTVRMGPIGTARNIVYNEGFFALYKGIGAVTMGIIPKIAIRFVAFERYKQLLKKQAENRKIQMDKMANFVAGLGAGITETIMIVNPADVVKIRLQAQRSLPSGRQGTQYKNAIHALFTIVREEGPGALYRGVTLCATRQAINQAVNFTAFNEFKKLAASYFGSTEQIPSLVMMSMGFVSGAMGPMCNAPIDIVKTKVQRQRILSVERSSGWEQIKNCFIDTYRSGGVRAFYAGLTPRILRVAPGQAVIFLVYEKVSKFLNDHFT